MEVTGCKGRDELALVVQQILHSEMVLGGIEE
jgi:hypothetical protein